MNSRLTEEYIFGTDPNYITLHQARNIANRILHHINLIDLKKLGNDEVVAHDYIVKALLNKPFVERDEELSRIGFEAYIQCLEPIEPKLSS
ncbi:MAG: hypothetical protein SFU25_11240 [Candidatus Caenarcaniphilales bacterium]|nr:hypothetical protein [Candidatus Caenarcaniphilales bacterium]